MDRVAAVLQLKQEIPDAEGQPVMALDMLSTSSSPLEIVLPPDVLVRLNTVAAAPGQEALLAYARGEPDQPMPAVVSIGVDLTLDEVSAVVAQVQLQRARSTYSVVWPTGPGGDSLVYEWLRSESRPLTSAVVGYQLELKISAVRLVSDYRSRSLEMLDRVLSNLHREQWVMPRHRPRGPVVRSVRTWFAWLDQLQIVSRRRRVDWRQNALDRTGEALRGLDAQSSVADSSYQTHFQLEKRNQGTQHINHLLASLRQDVYAFLVKRVSGLP